MKVETVGVEEFCRLCLKPRAPYLSLFQNQIAEMLESLTSIKISYDDPAPNLTCIRCFDEIKGAYKTQQRLIETEKFLQGKILGCVVVKAEIEKSIDESVTSETAVKCEENEKAKAHQEKQSLGEATRDNKSQTRIKCRKCVLIFSSILEYRKHKKSHTTRLQCLLCPKVVLKSEMKNHKQSHSSGYCEYCGKKLKSYQILRGHVARWHRQPKIICEECGDILDSKKEFDLHMKMHRNDPAFLCDVCGANYFRVGDLTRHVKEKHAEKPFSCSVCGQTFPYKSTLDSHEVKHSNKISFVCEACGKGFKFKDSMRVHQKTFHGWIPGKFKCGFCNKGFPTKYLLRVHRVTEHNK